METSVEEDQKDVVEVITTGVRSFRARPKAPVSGSTGSAVPEPKFLPKPKALSSQRSIGSAVPELKVRPQCKAASFQKFEAYKTLA